MRPATRAALVATLAVAGPLAALGSPGGAEDCDPGELRDLLAPGRALLLGEIHGSAEAPRLVGAAACAALGRGLPVTLALEIPREEEAALEEFLGSAGEESDRRRLLATPFWQRTYQDGRSSQAMAALLGAARRLRAGSPSAPRTVAALRVVLLDSAELQGRERDRHMGERLAAAIDERRVLIALVGNVHSRTSRGVPWDAAYEPAGLIAAGRRPGTVLSVLLVSPPGTVWSCTSADAASCGTRSLGGRADAVAGRLELQPAPRDGHDGTFGLQSLTASPPATAAPGGDR
jgi:hypothetical protein